MIGGDPANLKTAPTYECFPVPPCRAAYQRDELAPLHCPFSCVLRRRIAYLDTAGDCCNAGFRPGLGPLRVISGHLPSFSLCPLCPRKRTLSDTTSMSAL